MNRNSSSSSGCGPAPPAFPQSTANAPNLPAIQYRIGDFLAFRAALLRARPGEVELNGWRPTAEGDLALQLLDWWAYISDVLTYYNERIANENYLGTAQLPESVNHLVQLLGYRPRPALGATGALAALLSPGTRTPVQVPARLQVQSKPGPGQTPQVYEVDQATNIGAPDVVVADVAPSDLRLVGPGSCLWLAGKATGIKIGDRLLLVTATALTHQTIDDYSWIKVTAVAPTADPLGNPMTQLSFTSVGASVAAGAQAGDYLLLRPRQSSPLWTYPNAPNAVGYGAVDLAGLARGLAAGALMLIDVADPLLSSGGSPLTPTPVIVTSYAESVWYANYDGSTALVGRPPGAPPVIAIPHATIGFASLASQTLLPAADRVTIRWDWIPVGTLAPVLTAADYSYAAGASLIPDVASAYGFPAVSTTVLLEDPTGRASQAVLTGVSGPPSSAALGPLNPPPPPPQALASPIEVFFNLVGVSQGKTVPSEVLGSGDPRIGGQDFTLAKAPVTYFADPASITGAGFSSTVHVSVNGVQWQEVPTFYGQAPTAQVFRLSEDDSGQTHVSFGDGINGALLPTGSGNVVATYRYGAGGGAPASETLTNVLTPTPGLKGMRNPLPPTGGSDADSPARLRELAPSSVLTLNRVVSIDDFAVVAATAGGVTQAVSSFAFDPVSQRPVATIWVAGDNTAVASATAALAGAGATMRNVRVLQATPATVTLSVNYIRDPRYADAAVRAALLTALVDPDAGLLGANVLGIGQVVYDSQIAATCLAVAGVAAVQSILFAPESTSRFRPEIFFPGGPAAAKALRHDPLAGNFYVVPNDPQHVLLVGVVAT
jgi:hypothetical protein